MSIVFQGPIFSDSATALISESSRMAFQHQRRMSAWWKYWVVLCKFLVLVHLGTQKMVTQRPIPASLCSTSFCFSRDANRTSARWCSFFLAATGAPSIPIYLLADDRCPLQLTIYFKETLSLASVRCESATCLHLTSVTADTGIPAAHSMTCFLFQSACCNCLYILTT